MSEKAIPVCNNTSVGIIVRKDDQILLIERKKYPFGFAPPAGHVDDGEEFEQAAKRELLEEVGIDTENIKLLIEGRKDNACRRPNGSWHYWKIYEIKLSDSNFRIKPDEVKQAGWYSIDDIELLSKKTEKYLKKEKSDEDWQKSPGLELVWYDWMKELKIIK